MAVKNEIFIIDDDLDFRNYLRNVLSQEGYNTVLYESGAAALEGIRTRSPMVALIDLRLGNDNGLDVLAAIKEQRPLTECILLTGHASTNSAIEAINVGAYGYLQKPYELHELQILLRRAVEKHKAGVALLAYNERLKTLLEIDQAILQARNPQAIAEAALSRMRRLISCQRIGVTTFNFGRSEGLFMAVDSKMPTNLDTGTQLPLDSFRLSDVLQAGGIQVVDLLDRIDQLTAIEAVLHSEGLRKYTKLPLIAQGSLIGTLDLGTSLSERLTDEDIEIAKEVADLVSVAIQQAQLHEQIREHVARLEERVKERTAEISEANRKLMRASQQKDAFLANMSHELRTPLNAILGLSEVLESGLYGPINPKQVKAVQTIYESGHHLLSLINDILDVSKMGADKFELELRPVSVESIVRSSLRLIRQDALRKKIKVVSNFDYAVELITADERRLKQILVNLLSNAVKFTPEEGEVGLEVAGNQEKGEIVFTVWDTGIGISEEQMEELFQPFVQLETSLTRRQPGTGLGLVLAQRLTEHHNGRLTVESEVNKGSRFIVTLPWIIPTNMDETGWAEPGAGSVILPFEATVEDDFSENGVDSQKVILLAEDNKNLVEIYSDYLRSADYHVLVARDGMEGLDLALQNEPDLMIIDVQMPKMDGLELIRQVRQEHRLSTVPIIALTAHVHQEHKQRCLEAGATDFLSKPSSLTKFMSLVEFYLEAEKN